MKKNTHPQYQKVLFVDSASGHRFVCGSALKPDAKEKFNGVEYPVSYLSISSSSHPFFTGSKGLVDAEGRVDKFNKRFARKKVEAEVSSKEAVSATEVKKPAVASKPAAKQPEAASVKKGADKSKGTAKG